MHKKVDALTGLEIERTFECFFNFLGWWHWSIGCHIDLRHPHVDVHVPFGYVRLGWFRSPTWNHPRHFGYRGRVEAMSRTARKVTKSAQSPWAKTDLTTVKGGRKWLRTSARNRAREWRKSWLAWMHRRLKVDHAG